MERGHRMDQVLTECLSPLVSVAILDSSEDSEFVDL
jgi:hypothetical protein